MMPFSSSLRPGRFSAEGIASFHILMMNANQQFVICLLLASLSSCAKYLICLARLFHHFSHSCLVLY